MAHTGTYGTGKSMGKGKGMAYKAGTKGKAAMKYGKSAAKKAGNMGYSMGMGKKAARKPVK